MPTPPPSPAPTSPEDPASRIFWTNFVLQDMYNAIEWEQTIRDNEHDPQFRALIEAMGTKSQELAYGLAPLPAPGTYAGEELPSWPIVFAAYADLKRLQSSYTQQSMPKQPFVPERIQKARETYATMARFLHRPS